MGILRVRMWLCEMFVLVVLHVLDVDGELVLWEVERVLGLGIRKLCSYVSMDLW